MASFVGTTQKCTVCDKTAYPVDRLTTDGRVYHKACFRCHHCRNTLKLSNYCSFEGVLYCRPHYDQLYKRTGSLDKSFEGTPKIQKPEKQTENENAKILSNVFLGTKDKCAGCQKTVYPTERVSVNGTPYHKGCFKCSHGGCTITSANFITHEGKLYCKHHHIQLFKEKGNYSQLDGDRERNPVSTEEATALKDLQRENEENDDSLEGVAQLFEEQGCDDGCFPYRDNDRERTGVNLLGAVCGSGDPSYGILTSSNNKECEVSKENGIQLSHSESEGENRDPQTVLDKLNFQLLDKSGREMKIRVTYRTYERKKKKAQKATSVNYGGGKGGNGKSVKS